MTKKELCTMCTEYSTDNKCEIEKDCKLLNVLNQNKLLRKKVKELKAENSELRLNMSYMSNPNSIGYRNDMGW